MGYKCAPQLTGLVRGEPKPGARHRANGKAIAQEMGSERYSRSETLDRSRSHLNEYEGYRSGGKCWDAMCDDAAAYRIKGRTKDGKDMERKLRADAVIGCAVICNPPGAMTVGWTREDFDRFYDDTEDVLGEIEPRLFRRENVRMRVTHRDEGYQNEEGEYGEHEHKVYDAKDQDGRYCGNLVDAKLISEINKRYPAMMRDRGWDLDDLDVTDYHRMGKNPDGTYRDPEYRAQRLAKQKEKRSGRSVNRYVADVQAKAAAKAAAELADARVVAKDIVETARAEAERDQAVGPFGSIKAAAKKQLKEREEALRARERAIEQREAEAVVKDRERQKRAQEALESVEAAKAVAMNDMRRLVAKTNLDSEERFVIDALRRSRAKTGGSLYDVYLDKVTGRQQATAAERVAVQLKRDLDDIPDIEDTQKQRDRGYEL